MVLVVRKGDIMGSKKEERLGETFVSNEGCTFFIIEYVNANCVTVKFADEYGAEIHTAYHNCKKGSVKNPYFNSVFGVGRIGVGDFKTFINGKMTREYYLWGNMIERCYSGKYPTYANVTVCNRWLVYANFLEDLPLIEGYELWLNSEEMISLDKDLKQVGVKNKVYSLETVKFVTQGENAREVCERKWCKTK